MPPLLALVPLVALPLPAAVQTSPFGQAVVELEQAEASNNDTAVAVTRPKNIERISFLLRPPFCVTRLRGGPNRARTDLYPDARDPISQVTLRPTKSRVNPPCGSMRLGNCGNF